MKSPIPWIGGKSRLRETILANFPAERPERYVEVFGGAGWVLFARDKHAKDEVFNDINSELVNLYRCWKHHPEELQRELRCTLTSREQFLEALAMAGIPGQTDIQRAARYFLRIKESFGQTEMILDVAAQT